MLSSLHLSLDQSFILNAIVDQSHGTFDAVCLPPPKCKTCDWVTELLAAKVGSGRWVEQPRWAIERGTRRTLRVSVESDSE